MWNPVEFTASDRYRIGFRPIILYNNMLKTTLLRSRGLTLVANIPRPAPEGTGKLTLAT